ncbi:MAG: LCP family protein [Candidatus Ventricola sp.]
MNRIRAYFEKAKTYLRQHRRVRIACSVVAVFLALSVLLHPHGKMTFLVIGMDNYGSLNEIGRSDVTMLVQVDFTRSKISTVTFARDMFVENEYGKLSKINTIVRGKDEQALCDAVERSFGVSIDGWFRVNFTTVIELVDAIGGAQVELTDAEARYVTKTVGLYEDSLLQEGVCRLNGAQALAYARCRQLDNDLGRGERQGKLIAAMVKQTGRMSIANVANVFSSLKHAWRSSYSVPEQIGLVGKALWLRGADVTRIAMPFEGHWRYGSSNGMSGIVADLEANKLLLLDALDLPAPKTTADPAQ